MTPKINERNVLLAFTFDKKKSVRILSLMNAYAENQLVVVFGRVFSAHLNLLHILEELLIFTGNRYSQLSIDTLKQLNDTYLICLLCSLREFGFRYLSFRSSNLE